MKKLILTICVLCICVIANAKTKEEELSELNVKQKSFSSEIKKLIKKRNFSRDDKTLVMKKARAIIRIIHKKKELNK